MNPLRPLPPSSPRSFRGWATGLLAGAMLLIPACGPRVAGSPPSGGEAKTTLVISTDNAAGLQPPGDAQGAPFDDFLAIAQAMNEPRLEVSAIVATFTNFVSQGTFFVSNFQVQHHGLAPGAPVEEANRQRASELVSMGSLGPLGMLYGPPSELGGTAQLAASQVHFLEVTSAGAAFAPLPASICDNPGVQAMIRTLERGKATILAIASLTDVACLLEIATPQVLKNVERVVYLGGRFGGFWRPEEPNSYFAQGPERLDYLLAHLDCPSPSSSAAVPTGCPQQMTVPAGGSTASSPAQYIQPLPDANYNSDPEAARRVLASKVPLRAVVGTLAQRVHVDYATIGSHPTALAKFVAAGANKRGGARDVIAWDSTALNSLVPEVADGYVCSTGRWEQLACKGQPSATSGVAGDPCLTHRFPDPGGWLGEETTQLWIGRQGAPLGNREVEVCHAFTAGAAESVSRRIEELAY